MSVSVGLLDFYILEASEYVDQLDALVGAAAHGPPDSVPFVTAARALRGSSTMAKLLRLAELAGSVERVGRAVRDGSAPWTPELRSAIVAAIDDLRTLLRNVRGWGAEEEQRAAARVAELRRFVPEGVAPPSTPISGAVSASFFAAEVEAVAGALDRLLGAPTDRSAIDEALGRVRALRGIAALKELPPLGDIADSIERAAKTMSVNGRSLAPQHAALFDAATHALRRAARELRTSGRPDASAPEVQRFAAAAAALDDLGAREDQVLPVSELFYADAGPHIVSRADRPPTTPDQRFRTEVVAHAEHVRRLVADARAAGNAAGREHAVRELRTELRAVRAAIASFGHADVARFFGDAAGEIDSLDPVLLSSVDAAAIMLASGSHAPEELARRLAELSRGHTVDRAIGSGLGPLDAPRTEPPSPSRSVGAVAGAQPRPPHPTPSRGERTTPRRPPLTPTGRELHQFLQTGIAGFNELDAAPLAPPAPLDDATLIPIDDLLYRGRAALDRAIELRDEIRFAGSASDEALAELFDLLDLAAAD